MHITTPWRRMILQLSQRVLTDAETFIRPFSRLLEPIRDATAREVIRRQLDADTVSGQDPDEIHPELAADVCQYAVLVLQLNGEHRVRERLDDRSLYFNRVLLGHRRRLSPGDDSGGG